MPPSPNILGNPYVLLTITTLVWGGNAVAGKLAVGHVSPFLLTQFRWFFACMVILPFALPHLKNDWPIIARRLPYLFALGIVGFAVFNNLMYLALNYTTAINVSIEQASMPLVVFALNYILFKTRITAFQVTGFAITLVGVAITAARGDLTTFTNLNFNIGDTIMVGAIMAYGGYSVFLRKKPDIHLLSFMSVLAFAAFIGSIPFTTYEFVTGRVLWPDLTGWGVIIYAALLPSLVSQLFWVMGLEKIGSNRGGIFINLVPIFGALLAILILGEQFQPYHAVGLALVLGGITLAERTARTN